MIRAFLKIFQNSQENTFARVPFLIVAGLRPATLFKKRIWQRCFPVNFAKILRTPFSPGDCFYLISIKLKKKKKFKKSGDSYPDKVYPLSPR